MLIDGPDITTEISQSALTCLQLIMTNFTPPRKKSVDKSKTIPLTKYHSTERETPVAIYLALKIFARVRSETLIERLFHLGICIPYKRVLQITKTI